MDNKIIALVGVIGSGKDYYCRNLKYDQKIGFSDGVRDFTWATLGWEPEDQFQYEAFKTSKILSFVKTVGVKELEGRKLMENLATRCREYDSFFWANIWFKKAEKVFEEASEGATIVAHDCRYIEEAKNIFKLSHETGCEVEFIFLNYDSEKKQIRDHESEHFAQYFLNSGCSHEEDITNKVLNYIIKHNNKINESN